jgi:hypothetical protein
MNPDWLQSARMAACVCHYQGIDHTRMRETEIIRGGRI